MSDVAFSVGRSFSAESTTQFELLWQLQSHF
jgi:hypothetical protein